MFRNTWNADFWTLGKWGTGAVAVGRTLGEPAMSVLYHVLPSPCLFFIMSSLTKSSLLWGSDSEVRVLPPSLVALAGPFLWAFVDRSAPYSTGGSLHPKQVNLEFLSTALVGDPGP